MTDYWNHNTAYHGWVRGIVARRGGDVLDVGCGDGLLAARLAPVARSVTGIDLDTSSLARARHRLDGIRNTSVRRADFLQFDCPPESFDTVIFIATLHHMDLRTALLRARTLLRPDGEIAVVGLSANTTVTDWLWAGATLPLVRIASALHRETRDVGVATTPPREGLAEIRRTAQDVLPGVRLRRALYYRYLLRWRLT
jgi:2-polyprenyl-3-methyl-5-hydroxy-6-metoxy-1,4-benzoquinol methylase